MLPYHQLVVWQKAIQLVKLVYSITENFPKREWYGLSGQLRRATVSIPSNIAEGNQRHTKADRLHFLDIAYGSCAEVSTQLFISRELGFMTLEGYEAGRNLCDEIGKMLNVMCQRL